MREIDKYPRVLVTEEMISEAEKHAGPLQIRRTIASPVNTLSGILGEYVFAQYLFGDWRKNRVGMNFGDSDFDDIEVKASFTEFNEDVHLLVRDDYASKRKPKHYVQIIIEPEQIGDQKEYVAYICGFATSREVDAAPRKDFRSKSGELGGYECHYIHLLSLHRMPEFPVQRTILLPNSLKQLYTQLKPFLPELVLHTDHLCEEANPKHSYAECRSDRKLNGEGFQEVGYRNYTITHPSEYWNQIAPNTLAEVGRSRNRDLEVTPTYLDLMDIHDNRANDSDGDNSDDCDCILFYDEEFNEDHMEMPPRFIKDDTVAYDDMTSSS